MGGATGPQPWGRPALCHLELSPTRLCGELAGGSPRAPSCPSTHRQHDHGSRRAADPVSSRQPRPSRGTLAEGKGGDKPSSHRQKPGCQVRACSSITPRVCRHAPAGPPGRLRPQPCRGAALALSQLSPSAPYLISGVPGQPWEPWWSQGTCFPLRRTPWKHVNPLSSPIPPHSSPSLLTAGPGGPGGPSNRRP